MRPGAMFACLIALAVTGCDDKGPASPSSGRPSALRAVIDATRELPAIAGPEAGATGTATITLKPTQDADGVVTGGTLDCSIALSGFPPGTRLTAAHIHVGAATVNGPIIQDTGLAAQGGTTLASGSGTVTLQGVPVTGLVANALLANAGGYYFNVHSVLNPGGVARGQLVFP